jgi:hypothetical protein
MPKCIKLALLGGVLAVAFGTPGWSSAPQGFPADTPGTGELVCRLDRNSAAPGEVVRLTGFIRADHDDAVREVWHRIVRVSDYDPKAKRLKNLKTDDFRTEAPPFEEVFDDLPLNLTAPGAAGVLLYDVQTRRVKGKEFEFRPKVLGVYLIYTTWEFRTSKQRVESQPVLLEVKPPLDAQGRPVVKPEWLPKDER